MKKEEGRMQNEETQMKAPSTNIQAPEKHQGPSSNWRVRCAGRDSAPALSAPLSGATWGLNCAKGVNYAKGVTGSARYYAGGDGAGAPSLPIAGCPGRIWNLVIGISLDVGAWILSFSRGAKSLFNSLTHKLS